MSYDLYVTKAKLLLNIFLSILLFCMELFTWCFQTVDRNVIDFCMLTLYLTNWTELFISSNSCLTLISYLLVIAVLTGVRCTFPLKIGVVELLFMCPLAIYISALGTFIFRSSSCVLIDC